MSVSEGNLIIPSEQGKGAERGREGGMKLL